MLNAVSHSFTVKVSILIARTLLCVRLLLFTFTNFLYLIINNGLWWAGRQRNCSDALDEVSQVFSRLQLTVTGESPKNTEDQVAWDVTFNLISLSLKQKQRMLFSPFRLSGVKPKPKESHLPITAKENITRSLSELTVRTSKLREARENASGHDAVGLRFASDWLRRWRETFRPIKEESEAKPNRSRISFDIPFLKVRVHFCIKFNYKETPFDPKLW